ncbi:MAG: hypothetical protein DRG78_23100 [Epsilonproteobacteria bacterium]|nr:MAG: hypothetical protein DRG78_23100 [Campylobacterota bacterium]
MLEFILYIVIFGFIYSLSNKIEVLQRELYSLKRNSSKKVLSIVGKVTTKNRANIAKTEPTPTVKVQKASNSFIKVNKKQPLHVKENNQFNYIKNYFTSGNIVVKVGGVILFFGLAFLAKYASLHSTISIEFRMLALVAFSLVLITIGWRLRKRDGYYGQILQGVGIGSFYLVTFVSTKLYTILPPSTALIIMIIIVILGSILAIIQNAMPLAIFALGGGFLAPILTSDGSGSHIVLFTYYALLNSAIVGMAWYRSWRVLNLMGFVFTFVIATAWGILKYESALFMSTEPFLVLFFIFYLSVSILFANKQKEFNPKAIIDSTLVFGLPFIIFGLQISLVDGVDSSLAITAIVMSLIYLILCKIIAKDEKLQLLSFSFLSLGVIFFTIAIAYTFDAQITATLWAIEASAIIYVGLKQERFISRVFAQTLQLIATLIYIASSLTVNDLTPFINSYYLGYIIIFIASLFSSYMLYMYKDKISDFEHYSSTIFLTLAISILLFAGFKEVSNMNIEMGNMMLIYIAISSLILSIVASKLRWANLITILQGYFALGLLFFISLIPFYESSHPFGSIGAISIGLFFFVHYFQLYIFDKDWTLQTTLHVGSIWLLTLLGAKELIYTVSLFSTNDTYILSALGIFFILMIIILLKSNNFLPKVFKKYEERYTTIGVLGVVAMLSIWEVYSISLSANPSPLPYIPLLNPLELTQLFGFILIFKQFKKDDIVYAILGATVLVFSTVILARSVHYYAEVDYKLLSISTSLIFQMGLSILWSILAMFAMLKANSLQNRTLWIAGTSLIGVVVLKLFLVELANSQTVERIISFIAVGILLLLIGYFAPLPPLKKENE